MSRVPLFHNLPPGEIQTLLPYVNIRLYKKGQPIIRQGDPGDSFFIIDQGKVEVIDEKNDKRLLATLSANEVMGAISLLTGGPRTATAVAVVDTKVWVILKNDFDRLLESSPLLSEAIRVLVNTRIKDIANPVEVEHIVRSFDPCLVCTVHAIQV